MRLQESVVDNGRQDALILADMIVRSHLKRLRRFLVRPLVLTAVLLATQPHLPLTAAAQSGGALKIVVSINPYQDLVEQVAGGAASVSTILPAGASPHAFDPTPTQTATLAKADLIIMNGGLDLWLSRLVAAAAPNTPVLVMLDTVDFTPLAGHAHDHEEEHGAEHDDDAGEHGASHEEEHETANAHIWLDPILMLQAVDAVEAALGGLDPANAGHYAANAARTKDALVELDGRLTELLSPVAGAPFVPFHDAWVYFAERYHLRTVATLEPFPGREPGPRYVAEAVRTVEDAGAKAIFAERQLGRRSAEVVAESAGVRVAVLDPLGGAPGPETYEALLLENAAAIVEALAD